eukprot:924230-Prorocentrum_minimum.AAC.13
MTRICRVRNSHTTAQEVRRCAKLEIMVGAEERDMKEGIPPSWARRCRRGCGRQGRPPPWQQGTRSRARAPAGAPRPPPSALRLRGVARLHDERDETLGQVAADEVDQLAQAPRLDELHLGGHGEHAKADGGPALRLVVAELEELHERLPSAPVGEAALPEGAQLGHQAGAHKVPLRLNLLEDVCARLHVRVKRVVDHLRSPPSRSSTRQIRGQPES